jgi:hypothetical protein
MLLAVSMQSRVPNEYQTHAVSSASCMHRHVYQGLYRCIECRSPYRTYGLIHYRNDDAHLVGRRVLLLLVVRLLAPAIVQRFWLAQLPTVRDMARCIVSLRLP